MDLTADTVTPETLLEGVTAHDAAGNEIVGTYKRTDKLFLKQLYMTNSVPNGYEAVKNFNAAGIVLRLPYPINHIEFTVNNCDYVQYGFCEKNATLPPIINTGEGRLSYVSHHISTGTYECGVQNNTGDQYFFIGFSAYGGTIENIKFKSDLEISTF